MGKAEDALREFRLAITLDPRFRPRPYYLGTALFEDRNFKQRKKNFVKRFV